MHIEILCPIHSCESKKSTYPKQIWKQTYTQSRTTVTQSFKFMSYVVYLTTYGHASYHETMTSFDICHNDATQHINSCCFCSDLCKNTIWIHMVFVSMMQTYKLICCCCPNDSTNHMNSYGWWSECSKINNIFLMFLSEWCSTQWIHMVLLSEWCKSWT